MVTPLQLPKRSTKAMIFPASSLSTGLTISGPFIMAVVPMKLSWTFVVAVSVFSLGSGKKNRAHPLVRPKKIVSMKTRISLWIQDDARLATENAIMGIMRNRNVVTTATTANFRDPFS